MKKMLTGILLGAALFTGAMTTTSAAENPADLQQAASILSGRGVYQGDANGNLNLDNNLTRAELAAILTRMNDEMTDPSVYEVFCWDTFQDLPQWAKPYVGYCIQWGLMRGYDSTHFGPNDTVNPKMACTVVLRSCGYEDSEGSTWNYNTSGQFAANLGLIDPDTVNAAAINRGEMAALLCRASGWMGKRPATTSQRAFEITADGQYIVHADHWSREDFSQQANPSVFTNVFTRELYNTVKQTLIDGEAGSQPAFTTIARSDYNSYSAITRMLSNLGGGIYFYEEFAPQNFSNHYEYPGYFAVSPRMPEIHKAPMEYVQATIADVKQMRTDREKVIYLNNYLCSQIAYDYENYGSAGIDKIFSPHAEEVKGTCGSYAYAMQFLCEMADIPCIGIESEEKDHAWNMVYADGQWLHVDVTFNDVNPNSVLLVQDRPDFPNSYPEATAFLQELLVPGSSLN